MAGNHETAPGWSRDCRRWRTGIIQKQAGAGVISGDRPNGAGSLDWHQAKKYRLGFVRGVARGAALALVCLPALQGCTSTVASGLPDADAQVAYQSMATADSAPVPQHRPQYAAFAAGPAAKGQEETAPAASAVTDIATVASIEAMAAASFVPTRAPRGLDSRLLAEGALLAIATDAPLRVASLQTQGGAAKSLFEELVARQKSGGGLPGGPALPGVKVRNDLFGIDEGEEADEDGGVQLASVGGFGRMSPNGLRVQTEKVDVHCFGPQLVSLLKKVERHFGKSLVVTSGFRSSVANRRAGGARKSLHVQCVAADIQVEGVEKFALARYLRTLPERGGVGTYCRTESVHIDIGEQRDWHYPCRRQKKRRISA